MRRLALFFGATMLLAWTAAPDAAAQAPHNEEVTLSTSDPTGQCSNGRAWTNTSSDERFHCYDKTWHSAGTGGGLSFPLAGPCGTITEVAYGFTGAEDEGMWCTTPGGSLVLQNKDVTPDSLGRSRLSLGEEFYSIQATHDTVETRTAFAQGSSEASAEMRLRQGVTEDTSNETEFYMDADEISGRVEDTGVNVATFNFGEANTTLGRTAGAAASTLVLAAADLNLQYDWTDGTDTLTIFSDFGGDKEEAYRILADVGTDNLEFVIDYDGRHSALRAFNDAGNVAMIRADILTASMDFDLSTGEEGRIAIGGSASTFHWSDAGNDTKGFVADDDGIEIRTDGAKPACGEFTTRGYIFLVQGGAGVADTFEICAKNAADAFAWVALATP